MKLRYKLPFFKWLAQLFQKVSGIPPLAMPRAVAGGLKEVTAYGGCALNGIPAEYTELEYLQSDGNQYIDTGMTLIHTDRVEIRFASVELSTPTRSFFGYMGGTGSSSPRFSFGTYTEGGTTTYFGGMNTTAKILNITEDLQFHTIKNLYEKSSDRYFFVLDDQIVSFTPISGVSLTLGQAYIFRRKRVTDYTTDAPGTKISYVLWKDADKNLKAYFIPVKRKSDNELGMYDRVSQRFFTNQGTGTFVAGNAVTPSPDKPCEIWCNNGKLIPYLNAEGSSTQDGTPSPDNPVEIRNYTQGNMVLRGVEDYKDIYNSSTKSITRKIGVAVFNGTENWQNLNTGDTGKFLLKSTIFPSVPTQIYCSHYVYKSSAGTLGQYISCGYAATPINRIVVVDSVNFPETNMVEQFKQFLAAQYNAGTPVVVYYPLATETTETWNDVVYVEGTQENITLGNSSANAEYLLTTKSYGLTFTDQHDIVRGTVLRNCRIFVVTGQENTIARVDSPSTQATRFRLTLSDMYYKSGVNYGSPCLTSHFEGRLGAGAYGTCYSFRTSIMFLWTYDATTQEFKAWLADQYAAGTPVIVIYPLATPVTEQVTPQALDTVAGTNTLEITQASLAGLELAAEYKRR